MKCSIVLILPDSRSPAPVLDALTAQTVDTAGIEVVVVDGHARPRADATVRQAVGLAASRLRVRLLEQHGSSRAAAANRGVREAAGPLLLLLASDFVPTPGLVAAHLALHDARRQPTLCGLGPAVFAPGFAISPFMRWLEESGQLFGVSFTRPDPARLRGFWYGGNVSLRREMIERAGGFDEAFPHPAVDDYELGRRLFAAGMEVAYLPDAVAYHDHAVSMNERAEAMRQTGESLVIYERTYPGPHWWQRAGGRPDLVYLAVEQLMRLRWMITRRESARSSYFTWAMERELARGYRAALASGGRPPAPRA